MKTATSFLFIVGSLLLLGAQQVYARSSSMMIPITGTVSVPYDDSTETVTLSGKFHVVVAASESGDLRVHANLADVTGIGTLSESRFGAMGSTTISLHNLGDTIVPPSFTFNFNLIKFPSRPCLSDHGCNVIEYPPSPCLRGHECNRGTAVTLFPLQVTFAVRQTELGSWTATVSCVASFPPSPCMSTNER